MSFLVDPRQLARTATIANLPSGGAICSSAVLDAADVFILSQTTATVLLSNPAPTDTSKVRVARWYNGGTVPVWNAYGQYVQVGGFADQAYLPGIGWKGVGVKFPQTIYIATVPYVFPADTNENNNPWLTIPGGFCVAGSTLEARGMLDNTSGSSGKTFKIKFGSMTFSQGSSYLSSATHSLTFTKSVNVLTSTTQVSPQLGSLTDSGTNAGNALVTGAVDIANNILVQCSIQKVTGADVTTQRFVQLMYTHGA